MSKRLTKLSMSLFAGSAYAVQILVGSGANTAAAFVTGDTNTNGGFQWGGLATSFEFDTAYSDVSISAPILCPGFTAGDPNDIFNNDQAACTGNLYLLSGEVGDAGDVLAVRRFSGDEFSVAPEMTTLFSGINFDAGIYQLVMSIETTFAVWGGADMATTALNGVRTLGSFFSNDVNAGAPWVTDEPGGWNQLVSESGGFAEFYYTIDAALPTQVPEPGSALLLLAGLGGLLVLRRQRQT